MQVKNCKFFFEKDTIQVQSLCCLSFTKPHLSRRRRRLHIFLLLEVGSFKGAPTASQETVSVLFQTYFFPSKEFFDFCTLGTAADRPLKSANKQL